MSNFHMVHPNVFIQNPIISKIADEPYWTISNDKKVPIDAYRLLTENVFVNAKFGEDKSPLVTLHELDANDDLVAVNRTYRLRARENRIIMIDVEPEAPDSMKQQVLGFPSHYTELSQNGGVHLLIEVPDDCINDNNRYMFEELSVFKEPVPKAEPGMKAREAHFEVLFNDHYITFTKLMDNQKVYADFNNNQDHKQQLISFLDNIVSLDLERREQREKMKQYQIDRVEDSIDDEKRKLIEWFIGVEGFDVAYEQANEKTPDQFGGDMSRFEMSVASTLAYHTIRLHRLLKDTRSFRDKMLLLEVQDLIYAIYLMLKNIVDFRDKHDEFRDGMPWLLYTAKGAYEYIRSNESKKNNK